MRFFCSDRESKLGDTHTRAHQRGVAVLLHGGLGKIPYASQSMIDRPGKRCQRWRDRSARRVDIDRMIADRMQSWCQINSRIVNASCCTAAPPVERIDVCERRDRRFSHTNPPLSDSSGGSLLKLSIYLDFYSNRRMRTRFSIDGGTWFAFESHSNIPTRR